MVNRIIEAQTHTFSLTVVVDVNILDVDVAVTASYGLRNWQPRIVRSWSTRKLGGLA